MIKLIIFALGVYQAQASYGVYIGESGLYSNYHGEYAASYDNYIPKPYAFQYGVSDPHTGDHKSQWETKDTAGVVRGSYSLLEPDGTTRVVDYIADKAGFRAVVKRVNIHGYASVESHGGVEPLGQIIAAEPVAPVLLSQPELVGKQPVLYNEHAQIFKSYDGGVEDYQNLLPYQLQVPISHSILAQEKPLQIAPQVPGKYNHQHQQPQDIILHQPEVATYNRPQTFYQQVLPEYQQPVQVHQEHFPEIKSYQQVEPASSYYQSIPEIQAYQQVSPSSPHEQPIINPESNENVVPVPTYQGNLPENRYNLETVYGQEIVGYNSDSLGSQSNSVYHPHGKSSQSFAGRTGYQEGLNLNHGEYVPSLGRLESRYKHNS